MRTTVSDLILDEIEKGGTEVVFLVPGANIFPFVKLLMERKKLELVIANHELAAGFMAIAYAISSGKPGVVCTIGSPGLAYLTGAGVTAKVDNIPLLCISGNIPEDQWGQGLFQDGSAEGSNDIAIMEEVTGQSLVCLQPIQIPDLINQIRACLLESRPIHLQLPIDIQSSFCCSDIEQRIVPESGAVNVKISSCNIDLRGKVVFFIGQKAKNRLNTELFRKFVKQLSIGVITDIKTRGIIDESSIESLGYIGFNSNLKAIEALDIASAYATNHLYIIGVDQSLLARYVRDQMPATHIEAEHFQYYLENIHPNTDSHFINVRFNWLTYLNEIKTFTVRKTQYTNKVSYTDIISSCQSILPKESIYCLDSGQIRRAGNLMLQASSLNSIIQSDSLSPMGAGISAAIGVKIARPDSTVIALFGDGSMRMHGMELATAVRYGLGIIFVLCDNASYASTPGNDSLKKLPPISWGQLADSMAVKSFHIDNKSDFIHHLNNATTLDEPVLLWVKVPDLLDEELDIITPIQDKTWLSEFQK